jgi:NADH-quinone oxidoreductase subunit G/NADP-reducing hydrogenase subunit HndD
MINIEVNEQKLQAQEGETILQALQRNGLSVPTLCHMEGLLPSGACRMCVVEVEGMRGLVPSCAYPVAEGMKIQTHSSRAVRARKTVVELLLADHPDDCLYCVRNGSCRLQDLAENLGVRERRYTGARNHANLDLSSPSIVRDPDKCILCGKCVRMCEEIQGVAAIDFVGRGSRTRIGTAFDEGLNISSCVNCGQCIMVCPTGALREQSDVKAVLDALDDPNRHVVVQHAPSISLTLGEEFGLKPGADVDGKMTAALRRLGFDRVFDTSFSADLTIMEEASELVYRVRGGGKLPLLTSCSPGWVKFVEQFYPDLLANVSTCKSPQQMMGALIKSHYVEREGLDRRSVYSVSIMPCVAKKFEARRPEMGTDGVTDVDAVLTTRELARIIRMRGLDLNSLAPELPDDPFGERSTSGKIFGASGGVTEAAVRTAHYLITGKELEDIEIKGVRGLEGIKEAKIDMDGLRVGVAVVSGLGNARRLLDAIRAGRDDLHLIEIMACPGGCIAGGGQPVGTSPESIRARMAGLYAIDSRGQLRVSHKNPMVKRIYEEYLGEPLGERSHHLLHTHYAKREVLV